MALTYIVAAAKLTKLRWTLKVQGQSDPFYTPVWNTEVLYFIKAEMYGTSVEMIIGGGKSSKKHTFGEGIH